MAGLQPGTVSFDDPLLGDAANEMRSIEWEVAIKLINHLQEVAARSCNYRKLQVFYEFGGVPFFLAKIDPYFMIYAVEENPAGDLKISIMFAGEFWKTLSTPTCRWDGKNLDDLRTLIIYPRAVAWFA